MKVLLKEEGTTIKEISVNSNGNEWITSQSALAIKETIFPIYFMFEGEGSLEILSFTSS